MFSRKFSNTIRRKKRLIISTIISLMLILGIGYAAFYSDFSFTGNLSVTGYVEPTLYNVLKTQAATGSLALEYTGNHADSMDTSKSTEKIYHWYTANDSQTSQVKNKNNVVFAGQCWQMIRTTDTGGVKMVYNGEAVDHKCLNSREHQIGYNSITTETFNSSYWYGTDYTYDKTNNVFSISGTTEQKTWSEANSAGLIGKYTCKSSSETGTCSTLYLVESFETSTSANVIELNNDSPPSQFGILPYNNKCDSIADVGYMNNARYISDSKGMLTKETVISSATISTAHWYADTATWGSPVANRYNLDNAYQISSSADYPNLAGKYTFRNKTGTYTSTTVYYIARVNGSTMYYIPLKSNQILADVDYTLTYGDSYQDNGNGTYTITNNDNSTPRTINRGDFYANYNNIQGKYVCKNASNDTCSDLWYATSTTSTVITYSKIDNNYKYSNSFEYKLDTNDNKYKYFLDDSNSTTFFEWKDTDKNSISTHHYTCWNKDGVCESVSYINYLSGITPYYINLTDGKSGEDAFSEMINSDNVNANDSLIKKGIDAWFKKYLQSYDNYLEDTIFCNDRSVSAISGWNSNGQGNITENLKFNQNTQNTDLSCTNITDKFSTENQKARLTYKVGLLSTPEMNLLGTNSLRNTGDGYWLISPRYFYYGATDFSIVQLISNLGYLGNDTIYAGADYGVRPTISLKPGTKYYDGDGSMDNPYYVGETYNITNNNSMFNVKDKAGPTYPVTITSDDYVVTSFKFNNTLVSGDTFIMPSEDVVITDITYVDANYTITNTNSTITVPQTGRYNTTVTLEAPTGYVVSSFKVNNNLVNGNSFVMPAENVTITDITTIRQETVESDHYPYPNNLSNEVVYENTFENATSITVELTYQTEGTFYDWIYLYDSSGGSPIDNKKYGGATKTTETITVNSNYLKIVFKTNSSGNNYYGFKAVITPNYT